MLNETYSVYLNGECSMYRCDFILYFCVTSFCIFVWHHSVFLCDIILYSCVTSFCILVWHHSVFLCDIILYSCATSFCILVWHHSVFTCDYGCPNNAIFYCEYSSSKFRSKCLKFVQKIQKITPKCENNHSVAMATNMATTFMQPVSATCKLGKSSWRVELYTNYSCGSLIWLKIQQNMVKIPKIFKNSNNHSFKNMQKKFWKPLHVTSFCILVWYHSVFLCDIILYICYMHLVHTPRLRVAHYPLHSPIRLWLRKERLVVKSQLMC